MTTSASTTGGHEGDERHDSEKMRGVETGLCAAGHDRKSEVRCQKAEFAVVVML